jgi:hypothetical protein
MPDISFIDWETLWNEPPYELNYLAWPLIPTGHLCALNGLAKVGKSLLALEAAACIATGRDFLGHPTQQGKVVYIDFENSPRIHVLPRLIQMGFSPKVLNHQFLYSSYPKIDQLDLDGAGVQFEELLDKENPVLVVVDTISRAVQGEENSNDTWNNLYKYTEQVLKERDVAWLRLDHLGRDPKKGARGGSAKSGTVDVSWTLEETTQNNLKLTIESQRSLLGEDCYHLQRVEWPFLQHRIVEKKKEPADRVAHAVELLDTHGYPSTMTQEETGEVLRTELKVGIGSGTLAKVCQIRKSALNRTERPKLKPLPRETTNEEMAGVHDWESPPFNPYEVPPQEDEYY